MTEQRSDGAPDIDATDQQSMQAMATAGQEESSGGYSGTHESTSGDQPVPNGGPTDDGAPTVTPPSALGAAEESVSHKS